MDPLLVPVGHHLGELHAGSARVRQVRLGTEAIDLGDAGFELWLAAHGVADPDRLRSAEPYEGFLRTGLLAEVVPGSAGAAEFAARHRLLPLALSLGNTQDQPGRFAIGLHDQPLVFVPGPVYDLWQWAHLSADLWSACEETAGVAEAAGVPEQACTDPHALLDTLLGTVHELLAARVACLDVC